MVKCFLLHSVPIFFPDFETFASGQGRKFAGALLHTKQEPCHFAGREVPFPPPPSVMDPHWSLGQYGCFSFKKTERKPDSLLRSALARRTGGCCCDRRCCRPGSAPPPPMYTFALANTCVCAREARTSRTHPLHRCCCVACHLLSLGIFSFSFQHERTEKNLPMSAQGRMCASLIFYRPLPDIQIKRQVGGGKNTHTFAWPPSSLSKLRPPEFELAGAWCRGQTPKIGLVPWVRTSANAAGPETDDCRGI